jgi:CRP/FNR family transcriptional regulator, cyclic AMP receptor protein
MTWPDTLGWLAASLMLLTFWCADARLLRLCAMAANLAFVAYGAAAGLAPVMVLHLILLPINIFRWVRLSRPAAQVLTRPR